MKRIFGGTMNSSGSSQGKFDGCSFSADRNVMAAYLFFFTPLHNQ